MTALESMLVYRVSQSEPGSKECCRALSESTDSADVVKEACAHFGATAVDIVVRKRIFCQQLDEVLLKLHKCRSGITAAYLKSLIWTGNQSASTFNNASTPTANTAMTGATNVPATRKNRCT